MAAVINTVTSSSRFSTPVNAAKDPSATNDSSSVSTDLGDPSVVSSANTSN